MKKVLFCIFFSFIVVVSMLFASEADEFYKKAEQAYKAKQLDSAESNLLEALKLEPDNGIFRYILAKIQFEKNNFIEAKNNMEIVSRLRPSPDKGQAYNDRLKAFKKKVKDLQHRFNEAGQSRFNVYEKNKNSPQKLKLAVTLYQAFRLNPPLRYKNIKLLEETIKNYENALVKSFEGTEWLKEPMIQLAFLYEISNKKDKAAEVYMRALDYIADENEEFVITHRFDYLNRSNKEKLLDTIEAGDFSRADLEELVGSSSEDITEEDKKKIDDMINEAQRDLENASSEEEREDVLEKIKEKILEKQKSGEFKSKKLDEKLAKEGKTMEEYLKEQGL